MNGRIKKLLLAATAGALVAVTSGAIAQAPPGGPGGGMRGPLDRAGVIERFGLGDETLKLSGAQKGELDKAADAYVAEMKVVSEKYPMAQGTPPSEEGRAARMKARETLTASVNKVLDEGQKKTWEAAREARRQQMGGPGGGRPPGG